MRLRNHRPCRRPLMLTAACYAAALAGLATLAVMPSAAEAPPQHRTAATGTAATLCKPDRARRVLNSTGAVYVIRNDYFGPGDQQCITNANDWSNFTVTRSTTPRGVTDGYPYILDGCSWGQCSPRSALPVHVSDAAAISATWYASTIGTGKWNVAFDIWVMRTPNHGGQAHGAEVMIWLNERGFPVPDADRRIVRLDGVRWYFATHLSCSHLAAHPGCWNFVLYRRVIPQDHCRKLNLGSFFTYAVSRHLVSRAWWINGIEAGFEIWHGGTGLATDWFWIQTTGRR
jgi:hypothetical protein